MFVSECFAGTCNSSWVEDAPGSWCSICVVWPYMWSARVDERSKESELVSNSLPSCPDLTDDTELLESLKLLALMNQLMAPAQIVAHPSLNHMCF